MLTQERLKENLSYDEHTGLFVWIIKRLVGKIAGHMRNGYVVIGIDKELYYAHRLAWLYVYGGWPEEEIEHIDLINDHNWISNLREIDHLKNSHHSKISKINSSGVTGVHWCNTYNIWIAKIVVEYKPIFLGNFNDFQEAVEARKSAEIKYGFHANHGL